jgi:hypothetical protein
MGKKSRKKRENRVPVIISPGTKIMASRYYPAKDDVIGWVLYEFAKCIALGIEERIIDATKDIVEQSARSNAGRVTENL